MLSAIERVYQTHLQTGVPYRQDKAILEAIEEDDFTEPLNADDWDAYIYDQAFSTEAKLGINQRTDA